MQRERWEHHEGHTTPLTDALHGIAGFESLEFLVQHPFLDCRERCGAARGKCDASVIEGAQRKDQGDSTHQPRTIVACKRYEQLVEAHAVDVIGGAERGVPKNERRRYSNLPRSSNTVPRT